MCVILALCFGVAHAAPARKPPSQRELSVEVKQSIDRGVKFLLSRQNEDGSFGNGDGDEIAGRTALVTLALLYCGESHQSEKLTLAINYLRRAKMQDIIHATYSVSLRACVFATLPEAVRGNFLRNDLRWLLRNLMGQGQFDGMYAYPAGPADFSNSQYGVLGVWYAAETGLEVPSSYWKRVENAWRRHQLKDGGWGYRVHNETSYASMTAAGAATLFITNDYLHAAEAQNLNVAPVNKPLEAAVKWLGEHFAVDHNVGRDREIDDGVPLDDMPDAQGPRRFDRSGTYVHYLLFGYERVGEASGLTRFGEHRWYDQGADYLVRTQAYDGSWTGSLGSEVDTAYSLLFLSRGRAPVAIQKLKFGERWNNRPRDAANFVHFMRHAAERHMNWQIVDIDATPEELRAAPILYAASDRPIPLNEPQKAALVEFVRQGGLLLLVNEGPNGDFAKSAVELCAELFPGYQFRDLPADHPIFRSNFPTSTWTDPVRGLSNGLREMVLLIPTGDASWKWQQAGGATAVKDSPYAILGNLLLYLTDKANPRYKGQDTWVDRDAKVENANATVRLARLKYTGNWDPEPDSWLRLSNVLHNSNDAELIIEVLEPTKLTAESSVAHLTATGKFDLSPQDCQAIKRFIDAGGLLLFDAAGGAAEPTIAFETIMARLYPDAKCAPLPVDHPIYTGAFERGRKIDQVVYRRGGAGKIPATKLPRLRAWTRAGKLLAIESPEDISGALVGHQGSGITGYSPDSAVAIARNVLLWRAAGTPAR
ncbi:MAG: DUF4159 domain-containing protein [Tepidisphaeraceae bacterium]